MAREELEIEIDAQGRVTVHTIGFKGNSCLKEAEAIARISAAKSRAAHERVLRNRTNDANARRRHQRRGIVVLLSRCSNLFSL